MWSRAGSPIRCSTIRSTPIRNCWSVRFCRSRSGAMISVDDVSKSFTLHNQGGASLCVMRGAELCVAPGECVALTGPSGAGKSTLMRMVYGNYRIEAGTIRVGTVALETARPRDILALRRETLGHVSQFLRVVPRVPTLDVVAEPLRRLGVDADTAHTRAGALLER